MEAEKWFDEKEIEWLKVHHPRLYESIEDISSGTQVIFDARKMLDEEYHPDELADHE